jgi:hypothetical protein
MYLNVNRIHVLLKFQQIKLQCFNKLCFSRFGTNGHYRNTTLCTENFYPWQAKNEINNKEWFPFSVSSAKVCPSVGNNLQHLLA